jgi:hypothetical protein
LTDCTRISMQGRKDFLYMPFVGRCCALKVYWVVNLPRPFVRVPIDRIDHAAAKDDMLQPRARDQVSLCTYKSLCTVYAGKQRAESDTIHVRTHHNHMHEVTMTPSPNMAFLHKGHPRLDGWAQQRCVCRRRRRADTAVKMARDRLLDIDGGHASLVRRGGGPVCLRSLGLEEWWRWWWCGE